MRLEGDWICPSGYGCSSRGTLPYRLSTDGDGRSGFLGRQGGAGFGKSVNGLAEFSAGYIAQRCYQRGILHPAKELLRSLRQLNPIMPVANDVLHLVEPRDQARFLSALVGEFSDIASAFADNSELVQGTF